MELSAEFQKELTRRELTQDLDLALTVEIKVKRPILGKRSFEIRHDPYKFGLEVAQAMQDVASNGCQALLTESGTLVDMGGVSWELIRERDDSPGEGLLVLTAARRQWLGLAKHLEEFKSLF